LLRETSPSDEAWGPLVNNAVDVLQHGAEERAHGAFLALEFLESSLSPTKGGIQRILTAASLLPHCLFRRIGQRWHGFLIAGYYNEFFSSHCDVINLPFEFLFSPEEWCGLFHEAGHVAIFDTTFFNMDSAKIRNVLRGGLGSSPEEEYEAWQNLVFEVGADLFDLYFCYGMEIEKYLANIWSFLSRGTDSLTEAHFIRYFIAYQYWKYFLQGGRASYPATATPMQDVAEFRSVLASKSLRGNVTGVDPDRVNRAAVYACEVLAPIVQLYHERFRRQATPRDLAGALKERALTKAVNLVLSGRVATEGIGEPDAFILALKDRQPELTIASRQAAILSLWHAAVTR